MINMEKINKINKINKKNKKGVIITGSFLIGVILVFLGVILVSYLSGGSLAVFSLSQIPAPIWVLIGIILMWKLLGGKKK